MVDEVTGALGEVEVEVEVELEQRWSITGHLNGGYLAAVAGEVASAALVGAEPLTISAHYLEAARGGGPAQARVEILRRGRLSSARVSLRRGGVILAEFLVTVGKPRSSDAQIEHALPPDLPPWEQCRVAGPLWEGPGMDLLNLLHVRLHPDDGNSLVGGAPSDRAVMRAWTMYRDGNPADRRLAMAVWDTLPPSLWGLGLAGNLPTVAAQILLYPGPIVGRLQSMAQTDTLRDGIVDETSRVWDETGRLIVSARQTAIFIPA